MPFRGAIHQAPGHRTKEERDRDYDKQRGTARERGYDGKWQRESKSFLVEHPKCACGGLATLVHHLTPHRGDQRLFWSRSNWVPRCDRCHNRVDQAAEKRQTADMGQKAEIPGAGQSPGD